MAQRAFPETFPPDEDKGDAADDYAGQQLCDTLDEDWSVCVGLAGHDGPHRFAGVLAN